MDTFPFDDKGMPIPEPPGPAQEEMTLEQAQASAFWPLCDVMMEHCENGDLNVTLAVDAIEIDAVFPEPERKLLNDPSKMEKALTDSLQLGLKQIVDVMRVKLALAMKDVEEWKSQQK